MAGLNDIISNTAQQTTTMPAWFDTAQQNVVNQAGQALAQAPTPQNTVAQQAVNQMASPTNAFNTATGTLQNIASGAANPWITNPTTGQVTPDTSTALGGLFQAQNQQLQQLAPNIMAAPTAGGISSGQFGSLRTQTAADKALADAQAQLFASQNQAALQNQQTGVQAGIGAGNVAQQGINNALTVGQYQQAAPFTNVSNYGKVLGGIQAPTTVQNQTQLSPLNQVAGLVTALGGQNPTGLLSSLFGSGTPAQGSPYLADGKTPNPNYKPATQGGLFSSSGPLGSLFSGLTGGSSSSSSGGLTNTQTPIPDAQLPAGVPSGSVQNSDGTITAPNGQLYTSTGAIYTPPDLPVSNSPDTSSQYSGSSGTSTSTGGTSSQDVVNAAADQGYTYDPTQN
jgi:hypothetical protein